MVTIEQINKITFAKLDFDEYLHKKFGEGWYGSFYTQRIAKEQKEVEEDFVDVEFD